MRWPRHFVWIVLLLLAVLSGCKKKQPALPPPQAQAPNIDTMPRPEQPEPLPPPAPPEPSVATQPSPAPPPKPKRKIFTKKPPKPETRPEEKENGKSVAPGNNGENTTQLSAGLPSSQATQQRQSTALLLSAADSNLRGLNRTLSSDEQAMVQQIRSYMQQSRAADSDGDTERAYNLALKARLLSDELAKR